jgi:hypothetical protein
MKNMFTTMQLRGVALSGALILMTTSAASSSAQESASCSANSVCVSVTFSGAGCPESVSPADFLVENTKLVVWQSVNADGQPTKERYEIFFDPFKGQPHKSNGNGQLKSTPFDSNAPATASGIEYKYTIVGDRCPSAPLDPGFRLRR